MHFTANVKSLHIQRSQPLRWRSPPWHPLYHCMPAPALLLCKQRFQYKDTLGYNGHCHRRRVLKTSMGAHLRFLHFLPFLPSCISPFPPFLYSQCSAATTREFREHLSSPSAESGRQTISAAFGAKLLLIRAIFDHPWSSVVHNFGRVTRVCLSVCMYSVSQKTAPFYFCNNFVKPSSLLLIFWQTCTPINFWQNDLKSPVSLK